MASVAAILLRVRMVRSSAGIRGLIIVGVVRFLFLSNVKYEKFFLVYLVISPLVDQLIPFFTSVSAGGTRFGPQILLRGGMIGLSVYYLLTGRKRSFHIKAALPMFMILLLIAIGTVGSGILVMKGLVNLAKVAFWMFLLLAIAHMVARGKIKVETIYWCVAI